MKFIDKAGVPVPTILKTKGAAETKKNRYIYKANKAKYTSHTKAANSRNVADSFEIDKEIYGHDDVKNTLIDLQKKCCCFCESRITHISSGDIEHFRPKKGFYQDNKDLFHKPGYFWLAYEWSNLLFSCELCNRRYKKNFFPLKDNTKRCNPSRSFSILSEGPLFVNPCEVDPSIHITYTETTPTPKTVEGSITITELCLDRGDLDEMRKDSINAVIALMNTYERDKNSLYEQDSKDKLRNILNEKLNITAQYTMMFRDNFANYIREFGI